MALNKYQMNINNETKTIASNIDALLFNIIIYNRGSEANIEFYIDGGVTICNPTINTNENLIIKPEIKFNYETLKATTTGDFDVIVQFLTN